MKIRISVIILLTVMLFSGCTHTDPPVTTESATEPAAESAETIESNNDETTAMIEKDPELKLPEGGDYKSKTAKVKSATFKSFCQRMDSDVRDILIYCETEPNSTVYVCDKNYNVIRAERASGPCFYTAIPLEEGKKTHIAIFAKAEGKALSDAVKLTVKHTDGTGKNIFCGKDSKIYLNWYDNFYYGDVIPDENDLLLAKTMIYKNLEEARKLTGKNTKIIILSATNPAVIYHDRQYEEPFGRGDHFEETSTSRLVEYMKDDENVYVIDCRKILMEHRDEDIFYTTDSHWTPLGAYYCYREMMEYIKRDFPDVNSADILNYYISHDYRISDLMTDNFMNGYGIGMREYNITVASSPVSKVKGDDQPSAYYVGDSYSGLTKMFFTDTFSVCSSNELYDYNFYDLETLKPDYLIYVFTERNIDKQCSILWANTEIK